MIALAKVLILTIRLTHVVLVSTLATSRNKITNQECCVVILSYARAFNIELIIRSVAKCSFVKTIVVSNNNPEVPMEKVVGDLGIDKLVRVQQKEKTRQGIRLALAAEYPHENYIFIDDDMLLTPRHLELLFMRLVDDPSVPHGITGEVNAEENVGHKRTDYPWNIAVKGDRIVEHLNNIYALTKEHLERAFYLHDAARLPEWAQFANGEDILISCSGNGQPRIHDIGVVLNCMSSKDDDLATYKSRPGFFEERVKVRSKIDEVRSLYEGST